MTDTEYDMAGLQFIVGCAFIIGAVIFITNLNFFAANPSVAAYFYGIGITLLFLERALNNMASVAITNMNRYFRRWKDGR